MGELSQEDVQLVRKVMAYLRDKEMIMLDREIIKAIMP